MALGLLANIPDLFPKSTLEDSKGFETVHHELEYLPPSHGSGRRTSILRYYTVTYSYDAILKPKSQQMAEDEQESNGSEEIEVEVHALAYTPPTRLSSWRTSTAPNHIVTYCLDFESIETGQDDEDDSQKCSGGTDSVPESQDNEAKERSSSSSESTDLDLELADIRKEEKNCPGGLND